VILGTRGSELALAQARLVEQALGDHVAIERRIIRTSGDERKEPVDPLGGRKGMFTREIERALTDHEIDIAVHSAKDLPSEMTAELAIAAVLPRAAAGDALISKRATWRNIGTSSVRRQYQIRAKWPEAKVVDLRGNVPTRLRKLSASPELDAIVLARAGLDRLQISIQFQQQDLSMDEFVPAGGQGIIAVQVRRDDVQTRGVVQPIDDAQTHLCLRAEREFLRLLHGDCNSPVGVHAIIDSGVMKMRAQLFDDERSRAASIAMNTTILPEEIAARLLEKFDG
jgi:hydroxymethylbilane synthase